MTMQNLDYYRHRADEELAAAESAGDPAIALIHREMARRYRDLVAETGFAAEQMAKGSVKGIGLNVAQA